MLQTEVYQADKRTLRMRKWHRTRKLMRKNWVLYLFLLPAVLYIGVFHYAPMYGVQLAFKDFSPSLGVWGSPYVGMKYFNMFFKSPRFKMLLINTIVVSAYNLLLGFPAPVILALLLHYTPNMYLKKFAQTVTYAPHFISTVVMVSLLFCLLSTRNGIINRVIMFFGGEAVPFMRDAEYFRGTYIVSGIWQSMGFSAIIYIAALAGISSELHEAAIIDGASKWQRVLHIDIPGILPTITILLIMRSGSIMSVGFEKVFLMQTSLNLKRSQVISTYVYQVGLVDANFSFSAAVGFFNSIVNFIMIMLVNFISSKISETSLW